MKKFIYFLPIVFMAYSCSLGDAYNDGGGDQFRPSQTKILEVLVQPDTLAPADTASFTCVITDSTDARFKFRWIIGYGEVEGAKLIQGGFPAAYGSESSPSIKWIAPDKSGTYYFLVSVDNGSSDSTSVNRDFSVTVKQ